MALLDQVLVINTGLNLPAPRAAQMLQEMGATVIKVEPPSGDTFDYFCQPWYQAMHQNIQIQRIDLKTEAGQQAMHALLGRAQILITSQRPAALIRMGLEPKYLHQRYPDLSIVNIVGAPTPRAHLPGHDLTYQAQAGLVDPPRLPRSLIADMSGAQQAVIAALALLHHGGGIQEVALSSAAQLYQEPLAYQLTGPGNFLGGKHAGYNLYQTADGYIALAALEHYFWPALQQLFPTLPDNPLDARAHATLTAGFRTQTTQYWNTNARERDIPLEAVN